MVADTKKVQTLVNLAADAAQEIKRQKALLERVRGLFQTANPDVTGTALEGSLGTVNGWIDDVVAAADSPVADALIAARVPTHRGSALDG